MIDESKADKLEKSMSELDTTAPPEEKPAVATKPKRKPVKKTTTAAKKTNGNGADHISLKDLAKDYKMEARVARRKLRLAGLKPEGRWTWEKGSAALKKAESALAATEK